MSNLMRRWILVTIVTGIVLASALSAYAAVRVAVITAVKGKVEVRKAGEEVWRRAAAKMELIIKDKVKTGGGARCDLTLDDGSFIKLRENTTMEINDLSEDEATRKKSSVFKLLLGKLWAKVQHREGSKFEVATPAAVAGIRGTEFAVICKIDGFTEVLVFKGKIELRTFRDEVGQIRTALVIEGQALGIQIKGEIGTPRQLTPKERQDWQRFLQAKEAAVLIAAPTKEERDDLRREVAQLKRTLVLNRMFGMDVKKTDFATGRTLLDVHKNLVRVEQRLFRPSGSTIRFLNACMRGRPCAENLQYYQAEWKFTGTLPKGIIPLVAACAAGQHELVKWESTWANAAPTVGDANRDVMIQDWDSTRSEDGTKMFINGDEVEYASEPTQDIEFTGDRLHSKMTLGLEGGGSISMENWLIDNNGNILSAAKMMGGGIEGIRKNTAFEIAWNLNGATRKIGGAIAMNKGGIIDVVFIPDMMFSVIDAILDEAVKYGTGINF